MNFKQKGLDYRFGEEEDQYTPDDDMKFNGFSELESPKKFAFPNPQNLFGTPIAPANTNPSKPKDMPRFSGFDDENDSGVDDNSLDFGKWKSILNKPDNSRFTNDIPKLSNTPDEEPDYPQLASLFEQVSSFTTQPLDLTVHWKPFLPDMIPSIGSIDAFIKIPNPDPIPELPGLSVLDEPSISQSDPQILKMELRDRYGISNSNYADGYIGSIKDLENNQKALDSWLYSIEEIHRNRPPPSIAYTSVMPDFEDLMETWPEQFEEALKTIPLPAADSDLTLEEYARVICAFVDIPVHGNIVESLHHLLSLYCMFEGNVYFKTQRPTTGGSQK